MKIRKKTKTAKSKGERKMSDENIKVSELSEQEQKDLIAEAYAVGLKGVLTGYKVSTLKKKIAEAKGDNSEDEQNGSNDEQNGGDDEQNAQNDEQNSSNDEQEGDGESESDKDKKPEADKEPKKQAKKEQKPEPKSEGICHICRCKVVNGVCTGCGFHK